MSETNPTILSPAPAPVQENAAPKPVKNWTLLDVILMSIATALGLAIALGGGTLIPANDGFLQPIVIALAVQAILMTGAVMLVGMWRRGFSWADVGLKKTEWWWLVLVAPGAALFFLPIRIGVATLVLLAIDPSMEALNSAENALYPQITLLAGPALIITGGLLVPFAEELFFRGVLYRWMRPRLGIWRSAVVSGLLFGAAHFYLPTAVAAFILGVVLALIYERSGSLWTPIIIHAFNNTIIFVFLTLALAFFEVFGGIY